MWVWLCRIGRSWAAPRFRGAAAATWSTAICIESGVLSSSSWMVRYVLLGVMCYCDLAVGINAPH